MILEIFGAAEMIGMTVAEQDVFHFGWVEP
jgi:hypothetical protein